MSLPQLIREQPFPETRCEVWCLVLFVSLEPDVVHGFLELLSLEQAQTQSNIHRL